MMTSDKKNGLVPEDQKLTVFGPVNLSAGLLRALQTLALRRFSGKIKSDVRLGTLPKSKYASELAALEEVFGPAYPVRILCELSGSGLLSHMRADEIAVGKKFELMGDRGKCWLRLGNPFGPDTVDGFIAAKVCHGWHDPTECGSLIAADLIVRPYGEHGSLFFTPQEVLEQDAEWKREKEEQIAIEKRLDEFIGAENVVVRWSVGGIGADMLDDVAAGGKCIFVASNDEFFGGSESRDFRSEMVVEPSWLMVARLANEMILTTKDRHHCFLEGIERISGHGDVSTYEFIMGS